MKYSNRNIIEDAAPIKFNSFYDYINNQDLSNRQGTKT